MLAPPHVPELARSLLAALPDPDPDPDPDLDLDLDRGE